MQEKSDRNEIVMQAYQDGKPVSQTANFLNLSRQRIDHIIQKMTNLYVEIQRCKNRYHTKRQGKLTERELKYSEQLDKLTY